MWCGVVWCGVVRCGVVRCGAVRCGAVWCGVVWCGVVWCGVVWCGVVWCGMVWYGRGRVWYGMVWYGMVWYGTVRYGTVWYGIVWYSIYDIDSISTASPLLHSTPSALTAPHMRDHDSSGRKNIREVTIITDISAAQPSSPSQTCNTSSPTPDSRLSVNIVHTVLAPDNKVTLS